MYLCFVHVWRAKFRDCFASCPDLLTSASSVTHWSCSLLKCWSVANTRPFSTGCSWNQHLITLAFQYCKAWPCHVNLPRLARDPGSHLGEWKIQAGEKTWTWGHDLEECQKKSHLGHPPTMDQEQGAEAFLKQRQKHRNLFLAVLITCFASHSPRTLANRALMNLVSLRRTSKETQEHVAAVVLPFLNQHHLPFQNLLLQPSHIPPSGQLQLFKVSNQPWFCEVGLSHPLTLEKHLLFWEYRSVTLLVLHLLSCWLLLSDFFLLVF